MQKYFIKICIQILPGTDRSCKRLVRKLTHLATLTLSELFLARCSWVLRHLLAFDDSLSSSARYPVNSITTIITKTVKITIFNPSFSIARIGQGKCKNLYPMLSI